MYEQWKKRQGSGAITCDLLVIPKLVLLREFSYVSRSTVFHST